MASAGVVDQAFGEDWVSYCGDSAEVLRGMPADSIDLSVYSPPFSQLFTYSASERDLGNSRSDAEFFAHFAYIIGEVLRVTKPGRVTAVHVADIPAMLARDGYIGLKDFSGDVIRAYIAAGWTFDGRVPIDKNQQPLRDGTPVLTPKGWAAIEALAIGDEVIGGDGAATAVVDVPYRGQQQMYRLTFDDGAIIDCGSSHLWKVRTSAENPWLTVTAQQLYIQGAVTPAGRYRWQIPTVEPVQTTVSAYLAIHPRTFGALLADGNLGDTIAITKDREHVEGLPLPAGHRWVQRPGSERAGGRTMSYGVTGPEWHRNDVLTAVRDLGLDGHRAWEKFIPVEYLYAPVSDRRELLSGLLDGDGSIQRTGGISYKTTSEQLAKDIVYLVQSLGGLATAHELPGGHYGDYLQGRPLWDIGIRLAGNWCPFTLPRKAERWQPGRRAVRRNIVSIEPVGYGAVTCISVAAEDGLFVADGCVVTHNSQAIRTHAKGLTMTQMEKDRTWSRPALPDYILKFRKPGENMVPVAGGDVTRDIWIEWANPSWPNEHDRCGDAGAFSTWYGISESDTLNVQAARSAQDERHICPLQLGTIERCIRLWTNAGETVLDPFSGIASTGHEAVRLGRRSVGIELNARYWRVGVSNLQKAAAAKVAPTLFDALNAPANGVAH